MTTGSLQVLVVDDESLARARLRTLLSDCASPPAVVAGEAANAMEAMEALRRHPYDAVLLDVRMPGADGLALAQALRGMANEPAVVFVTAHAEHAVAAFDLEAVDYLTKPVRLERLQVALQKVGRLVAARRGNGEAVETLVIQDRGRTERVPLSEVLYFKAELKYITVRTSARSYILDASLSELEERHAAQFLRIHRNALVARRAVRALEKHDDPEEGDGWAVRLNGIEELLAVSRRQLSAVREALTR
ncbi:MULTISPECIES: LytR/AlgR family response regulator transcription factor [Ramlibacter]|jgi:two-component system response regulator AlgR|uniref:Response regulator n=1 Tax=Ramlibacter pinisoli TaxID=2682844 RepID=A0A6N8IQN1_9BURK|nr:MULTISPECIES: LytTR family DNA-binding domain-containing protein [Ramlibacter]MBA2964192.1 response regulator transcription factor [Ramlibacter sp. CGMCC 1.13660]MVQ29158.1 response regulator [Ramlibacter pinisoli]